MKEIFVLAIVAMLFFSCKKQSEEVESDLINVENPADSLAISDTIVATTQESQTIMVDAPQKPDSPLQANSETKSSYAAFGAKFTADKVLTKEEMLKRYKSLKAGDTLNIKFVSTIKEVCKKKGCWMSIDLDEKETSFVRFKDYGFFVPLNADGSEAIMNGRAYLDVISVAQLKHYAKDGGKSQEEINKITEPKITYAFQADGVLIKE
jgi:hypothetical protein